METEPAQSNKLPLDTSRLKLLARILWNETVLTDKDAWVEPSIRVSGLEEDATQLLQDGDINADPETQAAAFELYMARFGLHGVSHAELAGYKASVAMIRLLVSRPDLVVQIVEPSRYYAPTELRYNIMVRIEQVELTDPNDGMAVVLHGTNTTTGEAVQARFEVFTLARDIRILN